MNHVATDLLGKRVTVYEWPEYSTSEDKFPRRGVTGVVRAVTFGDYHPHRTEPAFHLLIEKTAGSDSYGWRDYPAGALLMVSIKERTFVAVEPETK